MAERGIFKENLRYHRIVVVCIVFVSIWIQYNFNSTEWNYSNGQTKVLGEKINGKDEGIWIWFHPNGKKQMEGTFSNGKRSGKWIVWDINGNKVSESVYIEDKLNGIFTKWDNQGKIIQKSLYRNDKCIHNED